jgi:uncharacterized protein YndB with AHSA1/START domain
MRSPGQRRALGLIERGHEERVPGELHRPDVAGVVSRPAHLTPVAGIVQIWHGTMDAVEYRCRDERRIMASRARCFETLLDLATYPRWWTLVTVTPEGTSTRLSPGVRFRFAGARPGGQRVEWPAEVLEVEEPARIELAYAGGEYLGRTAWELDESGAGTVVAYVYRGVRPVSRRAHDHFARWGTRLHSVAMQDDALAGLARLLEGRGAELDDEAWRADVRRRVAAGIRALEAG